MRAWRKFLLEPIQEQARAIGGTAHALTHYHNVVEIAAPEEKAEARKVYRDLAAGLLTSVRIVPFYGLMERLGAVRTREQISRSSTALIGLSNTVGREQYGGEDTRKRRQEIIESLGIELLYP